MAPPKFGRNYSLSVQLQDLSFLTIELPFTIEFDIDRKTLSSTNAATIRIYNLSATNRSLIRYDFSTYGSPRTITLMAGYGYNLPIIFSGNITQAWSVREGVNFITTIEAFDGGYAIVSGKVPTIPYIKGTSQYAILANMMTQGLPGTSFGAIGPSFQDVNGVNGQEIITNRAFPYDGTTAEVLNTITGNAFFIDNGKSYILGNNESIQGQVELIDSSTGLLGTPLRENNTVVFDMIFEPGIILGQYIELYSSTFTELNSSNNSTTDNVNGYYKITAIKHRGMISPVVCGDAITTVEFFLGPKILTVVPSQ